MFGLVGGVGVTLVVVGYLTIPSVPVGLCGSIADADFAYTGNSSGFMANGYGEMSAACWISHLPPGSHWTVPLVLHSNDAGFAHSIVSLVPHAPCGLVEMTPGTPVTIPPGGNVTFSLTVQEPYFGGACSEPIAEATVS